MMSKQPQPESERGEDVIEGLPGPEVTVGAIVRRLRRQRELSLEDLAAASGVSASFLSGVERGASDISVGRLSRVAAAFGLDLVTFLGYFSTAGKPRIMTVADRIPKDRGAGVDYYHLPVPGADVEVVSAKFAPHSGFRDAMAHSGLDIVYVVSGEIVLIWDDVEYPMTCGELGVWPSSHPHSFRNDGETPAEFFAIATETVWR
ncbi:MAG: XRE family transcriptional regulator [Chloroflexota bacterium]|nr:XRE family transcriptional regulator [Chloroflexota bacterium]